MERYKFFNIKQKERKSLNEFLMKPEFTYFNL